MHVSFVPRDEVTNDLERPYRTDIRVVNGALFRHLGSKPGIGCPGVFAFGPIGRKDGVSLDLFFIEYLEVHDQDR